MLTKSTQMERVQLEMKALDELLPVNHLVRKIEAAMGFSFIYELVKDLYSSDLGRPSIDPIVLFKMTLFQYTFCIKSMRKTIEEIDTNMVYRWFLGFCFKSKVPYFLTFGKNNERRLSRFFIVYWKKLQIRTY